MNMKATRISTLSLHDALPISGKLGFRFNSKGRLPGWCGPMGNDFFPSASVASIAVEKNRSPSGRTSQRSEEHTSELQSLAYLVCLLLLEKKKEKEVLLPQELSEYVIILNEYESNKNLHSFPTRRSSDLGQARFSIQQQGEVAWLVRPDGERFFSFGVCCVDRGGKKSFPIGPHQPEIGRAHV